MPSTPTALDRRDRLNFFVGIEDTCVYPRTSDTFVPLDEHVLTGHDRAWMTDVDRIVDLGADGLRYGMSWPRVHVAPGRFDWALLDPVLQKLADHGLHVMADLVHYGCPPWLDHSFVDRRFVDALTEFAVALVERYGDIIGSVTPINEPLTTASFCGMRGIWPPALGTEEGWASVAVALAEAAQSVASGVRATAPHLPIVHVEAGHLFETVDADLVGHVAELDMLGDLPTDLLVGRCTADTDGWDWLTARGISPERLDDLRARGIQPDVVGVNYYPELTPRVIARNSTEVQQLTVDRWATGLHHVIRHAADRYGLPTFLTETSIEGPDDRRALWLDAAVTELERLRADGVDVRGLTWWPLIDFVDWSYITDGSSVEEFVTGTVDPASRQLVAVPISERDRNAGLPAFARRMGLVSLADDGVDRSSTAASTRFRQLSAGNAPTETTYGWSGGASLRNLGTTFTLDEWTLTDPGTSRAIEVPKLWEADGDVDVDGTRRYSTTFEIDDPSGGWTLRFGAVMDEARVELNGAEIGRSVLPYTPFEFDVTNCLRSVNHLVVDVTDPPVGSVAHLGSAHGKQGWANHEFPSPPSMYLTYGGIWQPVTLRRHSAVVIRDISSNLDPTRLTATVDIEAVTAPSASTEPVEVAITVDIGSERRTTTCVLPIGERREVTVDFGETTLERWSPADPHLHVCTAKVESNDDTLDEASINVGLRTVDLREGRLVVNDEPVSIRSVLVQGFHHEMLYAEGDDAEIEAEIRAAQALGFNMLRLHLRPFDPRYMAACDRLGMLVHCDVSIAEPIEHDQLDDIGPVARRCAEAVAAQVRRDRSHPSIVLWSAMNEIGNDRLDLRATDRYERFARLMVATLLANDETRPFIENDWVEPHLDRVFTAPLATAHWYGHLDRRYLETLAGRCASLADTDRPVAITELGDWGLPDPATGDGRFYSHRHAYGSMLADTWWCRTLEEFSDSTQHYQAIADRLQIDVIRRSGMTAGYCVTELTDVPWEFNGLLDIRRHVKQPAIGHVAAANQTISPILSFADFAATPGRPLRGDAWIVNDSPRDVTVDVTIHHGGSVIGLGRHDVGPGKSSCVGDIAIEASGHAELSDVTITALDHAGTMWRATYPMVDHPQPFRHTTTVAVVDEAARSLIDSIDALRAGHSQILLVGEGALDSTHEVLRAHLAGGGVAVVLAQPPEYAALYPGVQALHHVRSEWGGTPFRYTTDNPIVRSFPANTVLHIHDADIAPDTIAQPGAHVIHASVGVVKPLPRPASGLVLGALEVGGGVLLACQYRLHQGVLAGAATACSVFSDIIASAASYAVPIDESDPLNELAP